MLEKLGSPAEGLLHVGNAVRREPSNLPWRVREVILLQKLERHAEVERALEAISIDLCATPKESLRVAKYLSGKGFHDSAERACHLARRDDDPEYFRVLARVYRNQRKFAQELEALDAALALDTSDVPSSTRRAELLAEFESWEEAERQYAALHALRPDDAMILFEWGAIAERLGLPEAESILERARRADDALGAQTHGIGVFYEALGRYDEAADAYATDAAEAKDSLRAELCFRAGLSRERLLQFRDAAECYREATKIEPRGPWLLRLGVVEERQGNWGAATEAYEATLGRDEVDAGEAAYRLCRVLVMQGRFDEACGAFKRGLSARSWHRPGARARSFFTFLSVRERSFRAARRSLRRGDVPRALRRFEKLVARDPEQDPRNFIGLGLAHMLLGDHEEAARAFLDSRIEPRPSLLAEEAGANRPPGPGVTETYLSYVETRDLTPKAILYESFAGRVIGCSPYWLFLSICDDPRFEGFLHVWATSPTTVVPKEIARRPDVVLAPRGSRLYLRHLATAKYLINNNTFAAYFSRRPGQRYLNTWHGTPLKHLGVDDRVHHPIGGSNPARNLLHCTHLSLPNQYTIDVLLDAYEVRDVLSARVGELGSPRNDVLARSDAGIRARARLRLGATDATKVVLYAPTWRGVMNDVDVDVDRVARDLAALESSDYAIYFKGHHLMLEALEARGQKVRTVPHDMETSEALAATDVLLTDYSSIFFDFLATGRPIVYYAYDLEEYAAERGLYLNYSGVPGPICATVEETRAAIEESLSPGFRPSKTYERWRARYARREDGSARARNIDFFFFDDPKYEIAIPRRHPKSVLMYQGHFIPNGITASFISVARKLEGRGWNVCLTMDGRVVRRHPERRAKFESVREAISVYDRVGGTLASTEERLVIDRVARRRAFATAEERATYFRAYRREFERCFGSARFDAVVNFEGYTLHFMSLLASAPESIPHRVTFLHNDMMAERRARFPYLRAIMEHYDLFDRLVSVSPDCKEVNQRSLVDELELDPDAFVACKNLIEAGRIRELSEEALDEELNEQLPEEAFVFGTVGRLSPEKGHDRLIRAFATIRNKRPEARLVIIGEGPERAKLESMIRSLGLQEAVVLTGLLLNPYPAMRTFDCFVLSSRYEGQGIVVIEALTLGKPVVSTDIPGPRSLLEDGVGLLVEDSEMGLEFGMTEAIEGRLEARRFDAKAYEEEAIAMFECHVLTPAARSLERTAS